MKCPNCEGRFAYRDFVFSLLPWFIKCKFCGSKFRLANQLLFWVHLVMFIAVGGLSYQVCQILGIGTVAPWIVIVELSFFIWLICESVEKSYGLKEIGRNRMKDLT